MWPPRRALRLALALSGILGMDAMDPSSSSCSIHLPLNQAATNAPQWHRTITTPSPDAQALYDQAVLLMAAFNHEEAVRSLDAALQEDPACLSCLTMLAGALSPNINRPVITQDALDRAREAVNQAVALPPFQYSPVEQALLRAMVARFPFERTAEDGAVYDHAYADALAQVAKDYPDDVDISVWWAEAALTTMPWAYYDPATKAPKPLTQQVQGILEHVLATSNTTQQQPLALHLYIHLLEPSARLRHRAVAAADTLRSMEWSPGHSHLMHMPGHIYIRTGELHAATEANQRAVESDRQYFDDCEVSPDAYVRQLYATHNMAFLLFAAGMEGRQGLAMETAVALQTECNVSMVAHALDGFLAYPAWGWLAHDLRFGQWDLAAAAEAGDDDVPFVQVLQHYVRAFALASQGKCGPALHEAHAFHVLSRNASVADADVFLVKASDIFAVAEHSLRGRLASVGCTNMYEAVDEWTRAVVLVDLFPYMEPPFWPTNLRACLGQALLDEGRYAEAEEVYVEDLVEWPGNGWSLKGLEVALRGQGREEEASRAREAFEEAFQYADFELGEKSCF